MWPIIKKAVNSDLSTPLNVLINSVKTVIDTVNTNVGSNANAASATGSVHAKLKELRTYITNQINTSQKPRRAIISGSYAAKNLNPGVTALNITGKGKLNALEISFYHQAETYAYMRITVDGVSLGMFETRRDTSGFFYPSPGFFFNSGDECFSTVYNGGSQGNLGGGISFTSSLKIEVWGWKDATSNYVFKWQYELE
jgi:hypothetical protein